MGLAAFSGCAKGPAWRLGAFAPWVQQQWANEEQQYGATLYTKLDEVESLTARAASMDAAERDRWSNQFAHLAMHDPSPLLRARVVGALPWFPSPAADAALHAALGDKDLDVRCVACAAWGRRGGPEALQLLSNRLASDAELDVRLAAIRALGRLNDQATAAGAVRALGVALDDKDPAVQYLATESLQQLSGRNYGTDLVAWREFVKGGNPAQPTPSIAERLRSWF